MQEDNAEQIIVEYVSAPREYEDFVNGTPNGTAETANGHDTSAQAGKNSPVITTISLKARGCLRVCTNYLKDTDKLQCSKRQGSNN